MGAAYRLAGGSAAETNRTGSLVFIFLTIYREIPIVYMFDLTAFQRDVLYVTAGLDRPSGQRIKSELQKSIDRITHGRLYPNLDTLVEQGYLSQGQIDRRTNYYELTDQGESIIVDRRRWEDSYVDIDAMS